MNKLENEKLKDVSGGMANPVSGLSAEEALANAKKLGPDRKDMGGWTQMNDVDYLNWWKSCNEEEYLKHKDAIDAIINA